MKLVTWSFTPSQPDGEGDTQVTLSTDTEWRTWHNEEEKDGDDDDDDDDDGHHHYRRHHHPHHNHHDTEGSVLDILQSVKCAVNCLQHTNSRRNGAVLEKTTRTYVSSM